MVKKGETLLAWAMEEEVERKVNKEEEEAVHKEGEEENMVKLGEEPMAYKMKEGVAKAEAEALVKRMKTPKF